MEKHAPLADNNGALEHLPIAPPPFQPRTSATSAPSVYTTAYRSVLQVPYDSLHQMQLLSHYPVPIPMLPTPIPPPPQPNPR